MRNRRSVAKLLEWDDHMLRDIGLTQSDVRSAMASPIADDPSYRLGAISGERRRAIRAQARDVSVREFRLESRSDIGSVQPGSSGNPPSPLEVRHLSPPFGAGFFCRRERA